MPPTVSIRQFICFYFSQDPFNLALILDVPPIGSCPDTWDGPHHVHPASINDGASNTAAQSPLYGQQWYSKYSSQYLAMRKARVRIVWFVPFEFEFFSGCRFTQLMNLFPFSSSICLQTHLCRGPTYPSTPKCLPPTSQLRYCPPPLASLWKHLPLKLLHNCRLIKYLVLLSQESAVQQPVAIETPTEHATYSYQHNK